VPAQQVIVITADFAGRVMVADVVIVGLGQRHMYEAENQNSDSQVDCPWPESAPIEPHRLASFRMDLRVSSALAGEQPYRAAKVLRHSRHYEPALRGGQAARVPRQQFPACSKRIGQERIDQHDAAAAAHERLPLMAKDVVRRQPEAFLPVGGDGVGRWGPATNPIGPVAAETRR
jgi:hypothetical protein